MGDVQRIYNSDLDEESGLGPRTVPGQPTLAAPAGTIPSQPRRNIQDVISGWFGSKGGKKSKKFRKSRKSRKSKKSRKTRRRRRM